MSEFLINPYFKDLGVPIITVVVTIFVKIISKNDTVGAKFLTKQDFAIGLDLCITSVIIFITSMVDLTAKTFNSQAMQRLQNINVDSVSSESIQEIYRISLTMQAFQEKLLLAWWVFGALVVGILSISTFVRKYGWESAEALNWKGIILPNIFGILVLFGTVAWIDI